MTRFERFMFALGWVRADSPLTIKNEFVVNIDGEDVTKAVMEALNAEALRASPIVATDYYRGCPCS